MRRMVAASADSGSWPGSGPVRVRTIVEAAGGRRVASRCTRVSTPLQAAFARRPSSWPMGARRVFHFDIATWGNFGDKVLFPVVRDAFRVLGGADSALLGGADSARAEPKFTFTSAAALRREV